MDHQLVWQNEMRQLEPTSFETWADRVEALLDFGLDGDQDRDGHSMDDAFEAFKNEQTPQAYASRVCSRAVLAHHH